MKLKHAIPLLLLILFAASFFVFPIGNPTSGIFWVSIAFLVLSLALHPRNKSLRFRLDYVRAMPEKKRLLSLFGWGIAALAASVFVTMALSVLLPLFGISDTELVAEKVLSLPPLALLLAFTLAPIGEEALFRGYLLRKLGDVSSSPLAGALLSSAIFAALHFSYGSVSEIVVTFAVALVLCAFTQKTKSLVPAVLAHMSFNFLSIFFITWLP